MNFAEFLAGRQVPYETLTPTQPAESTGASKELCDPEYNIAHAELLRTADGFLIAIVPNHYEIDYEELRILMGVPGITRASSDDHREVFGSEPCGVVPPFGAVFGIRTVIDIHLAGCSTIVFEEGDGNDAIRLDYEDFDLLEHPIKGRFALAAASYR